MKITIIIPNYNGVEILKKSLPQIIKEKGEADIIMVDDASTDDSVDFVRKNFPSIKIITKNINEGFSSTVNQGILKAAGDIIILLNHDCLPEKDFTSSLISHFDDAEVFAVGFLDKSVEGRNIVLRGRGVGKFERGFLLHKKGEVDKKDSLWVSGGSGAFRKSIFSKIGLFEPLYNPFYWEDIDLSYRAQKSGCKIIFDPKIVIQHYHWLGAIKKNYSVSDIKTISYRNQILFVWLNITDANYIIEHLLYLPYQLLISFIRLDFNFIKAFFLAVFYLPQALKIRSKRKKIFTRTDHEVLSPFKGEYKR